MWWWLYQGALVLAYPIVRLRLLWRARSEPAYGERIGERFGAIPDAVPSNVIWFHTVSAGETIAAAPLIRRLAETFADERVLVTTTTPTGSEQARERLGDCAAHCYAPYDFRWDVHRFFERVRPLVVVLMETELWPNLIEAAAERGIPVYLVNARLSERSARGYARIRSLTERMLNHLHTVACQTDAHRDRFVALGAPAAKVKALGSVKFDVTLPDTLRAERDRLQSRWALAERPVWIAASTHPGEDEIALAAHARVLEAEPSALLILVPRHPVRAEAVVTLADAQGQPAARQSTLSDPEEVAALQVVVGDVMGSLLLLYGLSAVAFVGGSLAPHGGHNPIEPALWGQPLLIGPHVYNFTEPVAAFERVSSLSYVDSAATLARAVIELLADPQARSTKARAGLEVVAAQAGAGERLYELLRLGVGAAIAERR